MTKFEQIFKLLNEDSKLEALQFFTANREELEKEDFIQSVNANLEILMSLNMSVEIFNEIERYKNYPYINQETEEYINSLFEIVSAKKNAAEKSKSADFSITTLKKRLNSNKFADIFTAISEIKNLKANDSIDLYYVLVDEIKEKLLDYKSIMILNFLLEEAYDNFFKIVNNNNVLTEINPKLLHKVYASNNTVFQSKISFIKANNKNISYNSLIEVLMFCYWLKKSPFFNFTETEYNDLIIASLEYAHDLFGTSKEDDAILNQIDDKSKDFEIVKKNLISYYEEFNDKYN